MRKAIERFKASYDEEVENMKAAMQQDIILRKKYGGVDYDKSVDDS